MASDVLDKGVTMSKQMPEGVPSRDEQHRLLLEKMAGNDVFKRNRGTLDVSVLNVLLELIRVSKTRSEFRGKLDDFHGDLRVLGNWLAQYRQNGWEAASTAFEEALRTRTALLPGEIVPVDESIQITLVMFEPEKTRLLLDLLEVHYGSSVLLSALEGWGATRSKQAINKFLKAFNTFRRRYGSIPLQGNLHEDRLRKLYQAVRNSYEAEVLRKYIYEKGEVFPITLDFNARNPKKDSSGWLSFNWKNLCWYATTPVLFWSFDDEKKLLSSFSREERKSIAVWTINFSQILFDRAMEQRFFAFGIHDESEHETWKKEILSLCSRNCSHGMGTIAFSPRSLRDRYDSITDQGAFRVILEHSVPR